MQTPGTKAEGYLKYVREGGEIFFQNCHFCHGDNLNGRGLSAFVFNRFRRTLLTQARLQLQETFILGVAKAELVFRNEGFLWASPDAAVEQQPDH